MLTRQIEKNTEAPRTQDLRKLEELFYNAYMAAWVVGMWTGTNRAAPKEIELATPPTFSPVAAIKFMLDKLALPAEVLTAVQVRIATYSSKLAILTGYDGFRRVKELFAQALEKGQTKKQFLDEVGVDGVLSRTGFAKRDPWYTEVVFRTNLSTAYNAGNWDAYQKHKKNIALYEYVAIEDARTTDLCRSLAGTRRAITDPIWGSHWPPNHFQCRSEVVAIDKISAEVDGLEKTKLPPKKKLEFEKGNESFKGNSALEFGQLSPDQIKRAKEMRVTSEIARRDKEIRKGFKKK
jgi:SPP1 gp7 family putative phage head morphogenesis protein